MKARQAPAECEKRGQSQVLLRQRIFILSAATLALGATLAVIGFLRTPEPVGQTQTAGRIPAGPAYLTVDVVSAVQAPSQVTSVELAKKKSPVDWDKTKSMKTVDTDPGGALQWDPKTGRARVCDKEADDHLARGTVTLDGKVVAHVRAGAKGKCDEAAVPDYTRSKKYELKVCLDDDYMDYPGYCNTSDSRQWPKVDRTQVNYCDYLDGDKKIIDCYGGVEEYCHAGLKVVSWCEKDEAKYGKNAGVLKPPSGPTRKPSITDRPDADLPHGQPAGASRVAQPVGVMLRWLVWTSLGACVLGFILVGGNMALKHKRGEAGAHASELGWVLIACVVAGSGLAIACISLLVKPL